MYYCNAYICDIIKPKNMKQLELELKKRLVIVEGDVFEIPKYTQMWLNDKMKLICKGSELTEDIAKEYVNGFQFGTTENSHLRWLDYKSDYYHKLTALESFISAIGANGYYWGKNPIEEPIMHQLLGADENPNSEEKEWQEAESKTFNPEKTLIFEIL